MKEGKITLTMKQLKRYQVICSYIDKQITRREAAELLSLSERQITRLKKGVVESGAEFLIHKNTGKKPVHSISNEVKEAILKIKKTNSLKNVNFLHFKEILSEEYSIEISYSSLYSILKNAEIKSPMKKKIRHRKFRRKRKPHFGQLVQIDATPFEWFDKKVKYTLHGAIDDATGKIVGLYMTEHECLFGYLEMMKRCCMDFGVPQTLYSDKHTIFRSPNAGKLTIEDEINGKKVNLTQFARAVNELGTDIIFANSPQAKGRIERLWVTLQSRLPVEFMMKGIDNVKEANEFLRGYIHKYNKNFSCQPENSHSLFVPFKENEDIDNYLCIKDTRKMDSTGVFSFKNKQFQVIDDGFPLIPSKTEIQVLVNPNFGIRVKYRDNIFETVRYVKPAGKKKSPPAKKKLENAVIPHLVHSSDNWKKIWWYEDYNQSLKFLNDLFFCDKKFIYR